MCGSVKGLSVETLAREEHRAAFKRELLWTPQNINSIHKFY
jgi:hypothetical protein